MSELHKSIMKKCFTFCIRSIVGLTLTSLILLSFTGITFSNPIGKTIAVMPFVKGQKLDSEISAVDQSITVFHYMEADLSPDADIIMTKKLHTNLAKKFTNVIPMDTVLPVYERILNEEKDQTPLGIALKLGKALNADYVVTGNVWRFRKRIGNALAAEQPASVAFKIHLIDVAVKTRIWRDVADKTQQPLANNLLKAKDFIKQGAQWLTAEDLAELELTDLMKKFPIKPDGYYK